MESSISGSVGVATFSPLSTIASILSPARGLSSTQAHCGSGAGGSTSGTPRAQRKGVTLAITTDMWRWGVAVALILLALSSSTDAKCPPKYGYMCMAGNVGKRSNPVELIDTSSSDRKTPSSSRLYNSLIPTLLTLEQMRIARNDAYDDEMQAAADDRRSFADDNIYNPRMADDTMYKPRMADDLRYMTRPGKQFDNGVMQDRLASLLLRKIHRHH